MSRSSASVMATPNSATVEVIVRDVSTTITSRRDASSRSTQSRRKSNVPAITWSSGARPRRVASNLGGSMSHGEDDSARRGEVFVDRSGEHLLRRPRFPVDVAKLAVRRDDRLGELSVGRAAEHVPPRAVDRSHATLCRRDDEGDPVGVHADALPPIESTSWPSASCGVRWRWPIRPREGVGSSNQKASRVSSTPTTSCSVPVGVQTMSPAVTS
jgi:hypothetical protein